MAVARTATAPATRNKQDLPAAFAIATDHGITAPTTAGPTFITTMTVAAAGLAALGHAADLRGASRSLDAVRMGSKSKKKPLSWK